MGNNEAANRSRKAVDDILAVKEDETKQRQMWKAFLETQPPVPGKAPAIFMDPSYIDSMLKHNYRLLVLLAIDVLPHVANSHRQ